MYLEYVFIFFDKMYLEHVSKNQQKNKRDNNHFNP